MFDRFEKLTKISILKYMNDYLAFINFSLPKIQSYYQGNSNIDKGIFEELSVLIQRGDEISILVDKYSGLLSDSIEYWDINLSLSSIWSDLNKIKNLGKWLR